MPQECGGRQQIGRNCLERHQREVTVRVNEAGEQRLPGQVDHLRVRALLGLLNLSPRANGDDLAVLHRHGLGARLGIVDRDDVAADVDAVRA